MAVRGAFSLHPAASMSRFCAMARRSGVVHGSCESSFSRRQAGITDVKDLAG
jgi:hypothetical protein